MKLSIIIPCYNEALTIKEVLQNVENADIGQYEKEIIVVDDGSTDNTKEILKDNNIPAILVYHDKNYGKGRAIYSGLEKATGNYVIIQDADLEYNPIEYKKLLEKISENIPVIYGMRSYKQGYIHYRIGAYLVTLTMNILYGTKIHDSYTCYKLIKTDLFKSLNLQSDGFEIEAEITAKLLNKKINIFEVPIEYHPRKFSDGKKIRAVDALKGLFKIFSIWSKYQG